MSKFKIFLTIIGFQLAFISHAQNQTTPNKKGSGYYTNPIFSGDYPDPSILRDGDDFYLVHSSFEYYPGLLIWHSKDLINWNPVTHALHKNIGSVYAPDLVKYNNKYYIYFPANGTNFVVTADSINGPWSDPIDLKIGNIDPGHIADEDGKRYLFFSNGGFVPLSDDGLSIVGKSKDSFSGWPIPKDWSIECFCLESPKLIKRGEYYYLTVAEGGTAGPATGHMVVSARSKSLSGPWENSPYNPIVRTTQQSEKWKSKGHATIIDDAKGNWWMVFHAYEDGFYNKGRQTMLLPIEWTKDGWYKVPDGIKDEQPIKRPNLPATKSNFKLSDTFSENQLNPQWHFFGEYNLDRFQLTNNGISIKGKGNNVGNSSPLLCVPADHSYTVDVELQIEGKATGGLMLFYDNRIYSGIQTNGKDLSPNLRGWEFGTMKNVVKNHVFLRLKNTNNIVDIYYSTDGTQWEKIENSLDVSAMHHNILSGFMSMQIGLCSIGEGTVTFKNFVYTPITTK